MTSHLLPHYQLCVPRSMTRLPELQCVSANKDSVTLLWSGNAPKYMIEYKRKNEDWHDRQMRQTGAGCPIILVISGLKKGTTYVFRLYAYERGDFRGPGREEEYRTEGRRLF